MIEILVEEHRRILEAIDRLERLVEGPCPADGESLMAKRWNFTRDLLLHFSHDESQVFAPLMTDSRPHIAALARQAREQSNKFHLLFHAHIARWKGLPTARDWPDYCRAIKMLMGQLRARLAAEESGLYQFLPAQPRRGATPVTPINYASDAWRIRDIIYPAGVLLAREKAA